MHATTILLALIGSYWALAGIGGWYMAIVSFRYIETAIDLLKSISTLVLLLSGYWIWFGWLRYSVKLRFPLVSVQTFWLLSLLHHSLCILYLLPMDVWGGGDDPGWIPAWTIANVVVALVFLILPSPDSTVAEAAALGGEKPSNSPRNQGPPEEWP